MTYVEVVRREAERVVELVRAGAPLDRPVPHCAGWTTYDLITHLGGVHRWAAAATVTAPDGEVPGAHEPTGLTNAMLPEWFAEGAERLVAALGADPDRPCWSLWPPHTVAFWRRRQAHETTVHRWDLETALGLEAAIDPGLARDGIDEVLAVLLPRQVALGRVDRTPDWVRLVVDEQELMLAAGDERADRPVATMTGEGPAVLLALWGRGDLSRLSVDGDEQHLRRFLGRALTP